MSTDQKRYEEDLGNGIRIIVGGTLEDTKLGINSLESEGYFVVDGIAKFTILGEVQYHAVLADSRMIKQNKKSEEKGSIIPGQGNS